jgi:uncharacterized membrane protein YbhN (UPF0104 family)
VNKRQVVVNVLKYGLAFGLLGWVIYSNWAPAKGAGLRDVWQRHVVEGQPVHFEYLAAAFAIFLVGLVLTFLRWHLLVRAQGLSFRVFDAVRLGLVGFFYNTFLPGSVGGDVVKAYAMAKEQNRRTVAVATVIMDRVIGLWGLFWFVAILGGTFWWTGLLERPLLRDQATLAARTWALGAQFQSGQSVGVGAVPQLIGTAQTVLTAPEGLGTIRSKYIVTAAFFVVACSMAVWLLLGLLPQHRAERFAGRLTRLPKIGHSAAEFWRAVWMYRCRQASVVAALAIAWVGFVFFVLSYYFCALALVDGAYPLPSLAEHFLLVPIGLMIMAVPLFPGGAGIGELGFGYLYQWFGFPAAGGVLATLTQRIQNWLIGLIGYGVYLRMRVGGREATQRPAAPPMSPRSEHRRRVEPEPTSAS